MFHKFLVTNILNTCFTSVRIHFKNSIFSRKKLKFYGP